MENPASTKPFALYHTPATNGTFAGQFNSILTATQLNQIYQCYFMNIAATVFEWENLPDTVDADFLEFALIQDGKAAFCNDRDRGFLGLRAADQSVLNLYGYPVKINGYGINFNQDYNADEFVLIKNNPMWTPTLLYINYFVDKIAKTQQIIDINVNAQKTPVILKGTSNQKLALANLFAKYDGSQGYIFIDKDNDFNDCFGSVNTGAPLVAKDLYNLLESYKAEFLSFLGVNNVQNEKAERLITDEVNANNQFVSINLETMLYERKNACKLINERFGLDLSVKPRVQSEIIEGDKPAFDDDRTNNVEPQGVE